MSEPSAGDRLRCESCGTEIIVVRAPGGQLSCCGKEMAARTEEEVSGGQ